MAFASLIVSLALIVYVEAIVQYRCDFGLGRNLTVPGEWWGRPAQPGQCVPCRVSGCDDCNTNYKKCWSCAPGFGPSRIVKLCDDDDDYQCQQILSCAPCPKGCGSCSKNAKKCDLSAPQCPPTQIKAVTAAKKIAWTGALCANPPGYDSDGYTGYWTPWVKDGICMDCNKRIYDLGYLPKNFNMTTFYCQMLRTAKNVAANAFKDCKDNPSFLLKSTCQGPFGSYPFGKKRFEFDFQGKCGDQVLQISVAGRYDYNLPALIKNGIKIMPTSQWQWTVAPKPKKTGVCSYIGNNFTIRSITCHRQQLVAESDCKKSTVRLNNVEWNPIWKLNGTSDTFSAIRSTRNCSKTVLAAGEPRGSFLSLGTNTDVWKYKIVPINPSNCYVVNLVAKGRSRSEGQYLTAAKDCVGLKWSTTRSSPATQFAVEKRCFDDDYGDFYCPKMLTKIKN